jgi:hypothetical protein
MHSTETINQFLNLRAQGWSFARIADHLHVSKPTLLAWNRKHQTKLESIKANQERSAQQALQVSDRHELQTLSTFYNALRREVISRTLKDFSDDEIQTLESEILEQITKLNGKEPALALLAAPETCKDGLALPNAFGEGKSDSVQPSQTESNQIQPPPPLPVKER